MSNLISLNGNNHVPQPSDLKEGFKRIVTDKSTITGLTRRIWLAKKMQVTLIYDALNSTDYNFLLGYFDGGGTVTYLNTSNGWSFTGFATSEEAEYKKGASLLKRMTVTIVQV